MILNLKTGERISIFEFFTSEQLTEIIINKIKNDEYTIVNEPYTTEIFKEYFKDEFIEDIAEYIKSENIDSRYHIQRDKLILSVSAANGLARENILIEFEIKDAPWN